jgi:hypothetical protein
MIIAQITLKKVSNPPNQLRCVPLVVSESLTFHMILLVAASPLAWPNIRTELKGYDEHRKTFILQRRWLEQRTVFS